MFKKFISNSIPFLKHCYEGMITIYMLHRVSNFETNKLTANENLKISPEFLDRFIQYLKNNNYVFLSLDDVYEILQNKRKIKKGVVFTLDDGYKDNFITAYPIFKKHNVPFAIYLTTSFPNKKAILWWYILEDLILANSSITIVEHDQRTSFKCESKEEKDILFLKLRKMILSQKQDNLVDTLNKIFVNYQIDWFSKDNELCMDWKEVIELSKDQLCTIANHTHSHYAFNKLNEEKIIYEIKKANEYIESRIGMSVNHFSYPFGSANEVKKREIDIVKYFGFKTATTARHGTIFKKHRDYLECLPRIMLTEYFDIRSLSYIRRKRVVTL